MKIALDAMGGDFAPRATVEGAVMAKAVLPADTEIILVGNKEAIHSVFKTIGHDGSGFSFSEASEVIGMAENPTKALAQKPDSGIAVGFELLKNGLADAFCGAGNTGAMHAGAMLSLKPVDGLIRSALAGFIPKENGAFGVILDIGANPDCKPEVLDQFAELGSVYAQHIFGTKNPKTALLNIGEEAQKGTAVTRAAFDLLKRNDRINFVGNVEGRDLFNEKSDVIVCNGFVGNVVLKMAEAFYDVLKSRNLTDEFINRFNYEAVGGSPILGINGNVVIGHGVSGPAAVKNMILTAQRMAETYVHEKIRDAMSSVNQI